VVGIRRACRLLRISHSTVYRHRQAVKADTTPSSESPLTLPARKKREGRCVRALSEEERQAVLDQLNSETFQDKAVREVHATLLEAGTYLCSPSTMYRILSANGQSKERRKQKRHPVYERPELLSERPNKLWCWDITMLKGPMKSSHYCLYVILDVFSRYVVGWMVAHHENEMLAKELIAQTCIKHKIPRNQLTLHADRGAAMTSKPVGLLLADLAVTKTHSRPYTSDDNPYSESMFKTVKYCPTFPKRFECIEDARKFCQVFITWYNTEHHHSGIAYLTPETVHYGRAEAVTAAKAKTLSKAYEAHPERFVKGQPKPDQLPTAVWINPPIAKADEASAVAEVSHVATPDAVETPQ